MQSLDLKLSSKVFHTLPLNDTLCRLLASRLSSKLFHTAPRYDTLPSGCHLNYYIELLALNDGQ